METESRYSFNFSRNCVLGRNVIICRLVIIIDWPVCGLRPRRGDLSRTFKLPNCTSLIDSPLTKVFFKVAKTVSTISAAFCCDMPNFSVIDTVNSFRVTVFFFIFLLCWFIRIKKTLASNQGRMNAVLLLPRCVVRLSLQPNDGEAMSRFRKISQTIWPCRYHIIFVPKYRFRILIREGGQATEPCMSHWKTTKRGGR